MVRISKVNILLLFILFCLSFITSFSYLGSDVFDSLNSYYQITISKDLLFLPVYCIIAFFNIDSRDYYIYRFNSYFAWSKKINQRLTILSIVSVFLYFFAIFLALIITCYLDGQKIIFSDSIYKVLIDMIKLVCCLFIINNFTLILKAYLYIKPFLILMISYMFFELLWIIENIVFIETVYFRPFYIGQINLFYNLIMIIPFISLNIFIYLIRRYFLEYKDV